MAESDKNEDLLSLVKVKHELASLHLMKQDLSGKSEVDPQAKPVVLAREALESVNRIIGAEDQYNYLRAKATAQTGQPYLAIKNQEKAQEIYLDAQTQISSYFGSDHPMVAKYN